MRQTKGIPLGDEKQMSQVDLKMLELHDLSAHLGKCQLQRPPQASLPLPSRLCGGLLCHACSADYKKRDRCCPPCAQGGEAQVT